MQPSQQFSARRLDPVLMLDLTADDSDRPGASNVVARLQELDPRLLVSLGFFVEVTGMREESGSIRSLWIDGMLQGSAYPLINVGHSAKYGTAVPNLDHEILRPVINDDGTTVEVWGTSLTPAVDAIDLVCKYVPNPGTGFEYGDRVRVYALCEVGLETNAPEEDLKAVLNRVRLSCLNKVVGGLYTAGDEN